MTGVPSTPQLPETRQGARHQLSTEALSTEVHGRLSTEGLRTEGLRTEGLRTEDTYTFTTSVLGNGSVLGADARTLLETIPGPGDETIAWLRRIASNEDIAFLVSRSLGLDVAELDRLVPCPLHGARCLVRLTRGRSGEIVLHDPELATAQRQFQTLPELAVTLRTGRPRKLPPLQLTLWRIRLLHQAGLLELPHVELRALGSRATPAGVEARRGFQLLVRCRWFLEPRAPVAYTRSFIEEWCGLTKPQSRAARYELIRDSVIVKVGDTESGLANRTHLYLPGAVTPEAV